MPVYLLHFDKPISPDHTAQHYIGYAKDVEARLKEHRACPDARLLQVAKERGIGFTLARVWPKGDPQFEKRLKSWKMGPRLCPICTPKNF